MFLLPFLSVLLLNSVQKKLFSSLSVLRGVWIKTRVFWDITPCRFVNAYRRFGAASSLFLRDLSA